MRLQPLELVGSAGRDRRRAAQQTEQLGVGEPVQSPTWARKSPVGIIAAGGVAHVLGDHRGVVVAAAA